MESADRQIRGWELARRSEEGASEAASYAEQRQGPGLAASITAPIFELRSS
jgi:hypothetical protein